MKKFSFNQENIFNINLYFYNKKQINKKLKSNYKSLNFNLKNYKTHYN